MSLPRQHWLAACFLLTCAFAQQPASVHLNEVQIIGSHNSYHSGIAPNEMAFLRKTSPQVATALAYQHAPLNVQLDAGVRQLEIDVFGDSKGGLFANPRAPQLMAQAGFPPDPPFDPQGIMKRPGFKVLHVQDIDFRSNCEPFIDCLNVVRTWSKAHPSHLPIFILVENKDGRPRPEYMTTPEPLTPDTFDQLDAEIRSVFSPADLMTPDDVRGTHPTLQEAVTTSGWPTIDRCRGKVIFLLDQRRVGPLYTKGHPALEGRVLFTNAEPGSPDAAFTEVNNPTADPTLIPRLIRQGYIVRTMTDPAPDRIDANDQARRDIAFSSGAQILSSDHALAEPAASGYVVRFDQGIARCNPVLKPAACSAASLSETSEPAR